MIKEELNHSIDEQEGGDEKDVGDRVSEPKHFSKQIAMMAAQNEQEDLEDPDQKLASKEKEDEKEDRQEEPGQAAAEKILKA